MGLAEYRGGTGEGRARPSPTCLYLAHEAILSYVEVKGVIFLYKREKPSQGQQKTVKKNTIIASPLKE